jgi:hypothetical protein
LALKTLVEKIVENGNAAPKPLGRSKPAKNAAFVTFLPLVGLFFKQLRLYRRLARPLKKSPNYSPPEPFKTSSFAQL